MPGISKKKSITVLIAMVLTVGIAGLAYAYWTSDGTGTGDAETGDGQNVAIIQTSEVTAMGPGVAAQTLSGTFNNPGPGATTVTTVTVSIDGITDGGPTCDEDDYVITGAAMSVTGNPLAMGNAVGAWTGATIAFLNSTSENQDDCKGATVNLAYVAS